MSDKAVALTMLIMIVILMIFQIGYSITNHGVILYFPNPYEPLINMLVPVWLGFMIHAVFYGENDD